MISLLDIIEQTTVDGPGFRTAVYAAGCTHQCMGCHNPESWSIRKGTPTPVEDILKELLKHEFSNVTFSGGDPMFQASAFTRLAKMIRKHSTKTIWCYTGYSFETLLRMPLQYRLLQEIDVLVDGKFIQSLADDQLPFRGSSNQRIIDTKLSLQSERIVLLKQEPLLAF